MQSVDNAATIIVLAIAGVCSCSSSDSQVNVPSDGCNRDPWKCSAGQTCWPTDRAGHFACLKSGVGKKAEPCSNIPGTPTCSDGFACVEQPGISGCMPYCDDVLPEHACPATEQCLRVFLVAPDGYFYACLPKK